jgi:DNA repair protein RecO (recombination protein O)
MRTVVEQVFLLHSTNYRENSALVRGLSARFGVVSGILRGVYQPSIKGQQLRAALQLGSHLEWQWRENQHSLKNITTCDLLKVTAINQPKQLVCLSYINELLLYFLPEGQSSAPLYHAYQAILHALPIVDDVELLLREFERLLFTELGFAIDFAWDSHLQQTVEQTQRYCLHPEWGIRQAEAGLQGILLTGAELLQLQERQYQSPTIKRLAKQINRLIIDYHLAGRKIKARDLYRQL